MHKYYDYNGYFQQVEKGQDKQEEYLLQLRKIIKWRGTTACYTTVVLLCRATAPPSGVVLEKNCQTVAVVVLKNREFSAVLSACCY